MMQNVRMWLRDPVPNQPSKRLVLNAVLRRTQSMFNRLSNTGKAWAISETGLTVNANQSEYLLTVDESFGKPLRVTTLFPGNQSHIPRDVDFFDIGDINYNRMIPDNIASGLWADDGSNCTADRIAFFRKEGFADNVWVKVSPVPMASASYSIEYSIGNWADGAALTDSPVLTQHHQMPEIEAALDLLPSADWWMDNEPENRKRRVELAQSLSNALGDFREDWKTYVKSMTQGKMRRREMYGGADF